VIFEIEGAEENLEGFHTALGRSIQKL
jgi:hypothetical protein